MYKLDVTPKITKELLLSKNSQETYFEHYLGISIKKGLFKSPSVIRNDHTPTCSFYKNGNGVLMFKDFAGPSFDFIGCVQYIFKCNFYNALRIIAHDFNIINLQDVPKNPPLIEYSNIILSQTTKSRIEVEVKEFSEKELMWWNSFGISLNTLKHFEVYSIKSVFLNGNYFTTSTESSPIFGYYGGLSQDGDEFWRLYMPTKRNYRFLSNWNSNMIQGSRQLINEGKDIVITKSLKDVMAMYEFGIPAIAPNSENIFLDVHQYKKLCEKFKNIFLLYDRDLPGVRAANKIRKKFNIKVLLTPKVKDFSDYVKKYGIQKTNKLIELWQEKNKL